LENLKTDIAKPLIRGLDFQAASQRLEHVINRTPLQFNVQLSARYAGEIYLKREDLQVVRSYKLRGAYNMMSSIPADKLKNGVVCASAGNHAQGFAYSCSKLQVRGVIFMPIITPRQKVNQVRMFGGDMTEIRLIGDTFDDCAVVAQEYTKKNQLVFIPPFDDYRIIEGQGTVAVEILEQLHEIDYLFVPVGGGGLLAGCGTYFKAFSPKTRIIGLEPEGAPSMLRAFEAGHPVTLADIDRFVDGAAVKRTGDLTFEICRQVTDDLHLVAEGRICTTILDLYNENAIVAEPAGAMSIAALNDYRKEIAGKKVVCILSGGNNDIDRMQEIKERSLLFEGLKHYFIIRFAQRPGALKEFVNYVLGEGDNITRFEYIQKHNKEAGPALIGIELGEREGYEALINNMQLHHFGYTEINKDDNLYGYLI